MMDIPELLSVSRKAETSLLDLTSAYAVKIKTPKFNKNTNRRGKTIYKVDNKNRTKVINIHTGIFFLQLNIKMKEMVEEETAIKRHQFFRCCVRLKKLKDLKMYLYIKTGTTNKNYDAWFIGFSSNLVVGA